MLFVSCYGRTNLEHCTASQKAEIPRVAHVTWRTQGRSLLVRLLPSKGAHQVSNSPGFQWKFCVKVQHGRQWAQNGAPCWAAAPVAGALLHDAGSTRALEFSFNVEKNVQLIPLDCLLLSRAMWKYLTSIWKYIRKVNLIYHLKNRSFYIQKPLLLIRL